MFIRNLTLKLKRYYSIKAQKSVDSVTHSSSVESTLSSGTSDSLELNILKDLYNLESDYEDEDMLLTQHLSTSPPVQHSKFRPKSVFNPTHAKGPYRQTFYQDVFSDMQKLCQHTHHSHSNLTPHEKSAFELLTDNRDIVIKTADKDIVIQNRSDYLAEARRLLSDDNA